MIPLIAALAEARRASGLHQQHIATGLGLGAKAGISMVSAWERGHAVPKVGHACGYATLTSRRIVVVRDSEVVGDLADLMPQLRDLVEEAGLSVTDVAAGLFVDRSTIASILRLAGPRTQLTSAMSVLGAVRCTLDLVSAEPAVNRDLDRLISDGAA